MLIQVLLFLTGLFLLYLGAEFLVRGAANLAYLANIRPFVVGVTVVAFGTSSPEIIVSFVAAFSKQMDVALGNIVGSNIANIGLILGISALLKPVLVTRKMVGREMYWMLAASILFWIFSYDRTIDPWQGMVMFAGIIIFTTQLVRSGMQEREMVKNSDEKGKESIKRLLKYSPRVRVLVYLALIAISIFILVWGSNITISSATGIARMLGVSEIVIGLSLVAFGTSLPELATAIISIIRRENEILVGNVVGSNLFNLLFVGGAVSSFYGINTTGKVVFIDLPVMLAFSLVLVPAVLWWKRINRWLGALLLGGYGFYIALIFLMR